MATYSFACSDEQRSEIAAIVDELADSLGVAKGEAVMKVLTAEAQTRRLAAVPSLAGHVDAFQHAMAAASAQLDAVVAAYASLQEAEQARAAKEMAGLTATIAELRAERDQAKADLVEGEQAMEAYAARVKAEAADDVEAAMSQVKAAEQRAAEAERRADEAEARAGAAEAKAADFEALAAKLDTLLSRQNG